MRAQRGFTLMELMITVAVIGVLAKIAYPMFFGETRKQRAKSEVGAMFAELAIREEQYKLENGVYMDAPMCPTTPVAKGQSVTSCLGTGTQWNKLRVRVQENKLACAYQVVTGTGAGTNNPNGFTFTSPTGAWFYVIAWCDMDNSSTKDSYYFVASTNSTVQTQNEGY